MLRSERTVVLSRTASAGFSVIMGRNMATSQDDVTWAWGFDVTTASSRAAAAAVRSVD